MKIAFLCRCRGDRRLSVTRMAIQHDSRTLETLSSKSENVLLTEPKKSLLEDRSVPGRSFVPLPVKNGVSEGLNYADPLSLISQSTSLVCLHRLNPEDPEVSSW